MKLADLNNVINRESKFFVVDDGCIYLLDRDSHLTMTVYGDYIVANVRITDKDSIEITLKMQPVKA